MFRYITVLISLLSLLACKNISLTNASLDGVSGAAEVVQQSNQSTFLPTNWKFRAQDAQRALYKEHNSNLVSQYYSRNYTQHHPKKKKGLQAILDLLPALQEAGTTCRTHRMLQDGDYVVMHNTYQDAAPLGDDQLVAFDILHMDEDGKVSEHWAAITPNIGTVPSGRTQVDGANAVLHQELTQQNKNFIKSFYNNVLLANNLPLLATYFDGPYLDQHSTHMKEGLASFQESVQEMRAGGKLWQYKKLIQILGEGNMVFTLSEGVWYGKKHFIYDLYRIRNGKIIEHWDVIN